MSLEIPLGKRSPFYRFLEILPAVTSYGAIALLIILSFTNPLLGVIYLLVIITATLVKAISIAYRTLGGHAVLVKAMRAEWPARLAHLENPEKYRQILKYEKSSSYDHTRHLNILNAIADAKPGYFPKPSQIYHAVIIATYNESLDTLIPTIDSVAATSYPKERMIILLAYEERGGPATERNAIKLQKIYKKKFKDFIIVKHPDGLPNEIIGKGANITYAGHALADYVEAEHIKFSDVIVTTLDSDNRPHHAYFDYVAYEYVVHEDRKHLSYQPISLFMNNIWDAPAPMRVIATGNSFWNIISSMRPHSIRNFASHSQPLDALHEMKFWSTRSIVEDGHQYWRSYFHFKGDYAVLPIHIPIYQDAVLSHSLWKTLKAQFIQLRRWGYGSSDIPYVGTRVFSRKRKVPLLDGLAKFWRLYDSHVTVASTAPLVAFGGWIPLIVNGWSASRSLITHQLPTIVSHIQTFAMLGLFITIMLSIRMLPPRPARYRRHRTIFMVLQWVLMPATSIIYQSFAYFYSQTRLALGLYMEKFDVTDKATVPSEPVNKLKRK